jgi:hypothetical protein
MWKSSLQVPFQQLETQHHERVDSHVPLCCQSTKKTFSNVLQVPTINHTILYFFLLRGGDSL